MPDSTIVIIEKAFLVEKFISQESPILIIPGIEQEEANSICEKLKGAGDRLGREFPNTILANPVIIDGNAIFAVPYAFSPEVESHVRSVVKGAIGDRDWNVIDEPLGEAKNRVTVKDILLRVKEISMDVEALNREETIDRPRTIRTANEAAEIRRRLLEEMKNRGKQ